MNKVCLIGRLTRDPELRYTSNNKAVASFTLAVNRQFTNQSGEREADFIPIVVWGKQAENVKNYINQGSQIAVEGRIQTRNYDDKDGKKVYVTEILANNISFLDAKGSGSSGNNSFYGMPEPPMEQEAVQPERVETVSATKDPFEAFGDSIEISDNDLPF